MYERRYLIRRGAKGSALCGLILLFLVACGDSANAPDTGDSDSADGTFHVPIVTKVYDPPPRPGIHDIWGSDGDHVFAVGEKGGIVHYDGSVWTDVESGTEFDLNSVWGAGPSDVYAVGDEGMVLRYDGSSWSFQTTGATADLNDIWGSGPGDIWIAGDDRHLLHYDGITWTNEEPGIDVDYLSLWGFGPDSVYAVGSDQWWGVLLRYQDDAWEEVECDSFPTIGSLWGSSGNNLFGCPLFWDWPIMRYDGVRWEPQDTLEFTQDYYYNARVWGVDESNVFVTVGTDILQYFNGTSWDEVQTGTASSLIAIWGTSTTDLFAGGPAGALVHYDGVSWEVQRDENPKSLWSAWVSPGGNVFAVGREGGVLQRIDGVWRGLTLPIDRAYTGLHGVWGFSDSDVYAVGGGGSSFVGYHPLQVFSFDGSIWRKVASFGSGQLVDVWGSSPDNLYLVGGHNPWVNNSGFIYHLDRWGNPQQILTRGSSLMGIWGSSSTDIWVVGRNGGILHFNGTDWDDVEGGGDHDFLDVWGVSSSEVYAVSSQGGILRWDGKAWEEEVSGLGTPLWGVWGTKDHGVIAAGPGVILVREPSHWRVMSLDREWSIVDIHGNDSGETYAVGYQGQVFSVAW